MNTTQLHGLFSTLCFSFQVCSLLWGNGAETGRFLVCRSLGFVVLPRMKFPHSIVHPDKRSQSIISSTEAASSANIQKSTEKSSILCLPWRREKLCVSPAELPAERASDKNRVESAESVYGLSLSRQDSTADSECSSVNAFNVEVTE